MGGLGAVSSRYGLSLSAVRSARKLTLLRSPIDPAPRLTWVGSEVKLGAGPGQVGLTARST